MNDNLLTPFELYHRKDSANYWMRFSIRGKGQIRISLKTTDFEEAEDKAKKEHLRFQLRAEDGRYSTPKTFERIARDYAVEIEKEVQLGLKKAYRGQSDPHVVDRYLIPFFGKTRIDNVTEGQVLKFIEWRRRYWMDGPGKQIDKVEHVRNGRRYFHPIKHAAPAANTIRGNCAVLANIFRYAAAQGDLKSSDIPRIRLPKAKPNPRPSFSLDEVNKVFELAEARLGVPMLSDRQRYERLMLYCYVNIAAYTGLRPVELHNLNWQHVANFADSVDLPIREQDIRIHAFGKTEPRVVVPMEHAIGAFDLCVSAWKIAPCLGVIGVQD